MSTSSINHETGENSEEGRSPRFTSWVFYLLSSVVVLKAGVEVRNDMEDPNKAANWAVVSTAITFTISAIVVLLHLAPVYSVYFVGTKVEGAVVLLLAGFSTSLVSVVSNTNNELGAVKSDTNQVSNGNLYYFSWAGFATSILLLVSYLKSSFGIDLVEEMHGRGARLMYWGGMLAASLVVTGSSVRVLNDDCGSDSTFPESYCKRTKLGIGIGVIGVVFAVIIIGLKLVLAASPFQVEFGMSSLLTVLTAFGVAYITSNSGPGRAIGNLYYAAWITFLLSAYLAVDCFNSKRAPPVDNTSTQNQDSKQTEEDDVDLPLDNLDDQI